jgi:hypothetical protein
MYEGGERPPQLKKKSKVYDFERGMGKEYYMEDYILEEARRWDPVAMAMGGGSPSIGASLGLLRRDI